MTQKLKTDSVIAEIHKTRREISERFNGDIAAIAEDAARRQAASGRPVWQRKDDEQIDEPERQSSG
jgi:hypothetical protein